MYPTFTVWLFLVWPGVTASGLFFCLWLRIFNRYFNSVPASLTLLPRYPFPFIFVARPQMRVRPSGFYEPFFRVVPCGLRAWQGKATTDFHLKPQNRICGPSRHTSPDAMQPVEVQLLPLIRIGHTELPVPRCRSKIPFVSGRIIPLLVFCPA